MALQNILFYEVHFFKIKNGFKQTKIQFFENSKVALLLKQN